MKIILTYIFIACTLIMNAQSGINLSGKIIDAKNKGIDLALVALLNPVDSSFVKSEFTDQDGTFLLSNILPGDYSLQVNLLGFQSHSQPLKIEVSNKDMEIPSITLLLDEQLLDEVTVTEKIPYIQRKLDRTIVTPDALISNAGSNALEVLERAPGISIDNNGALILKGRSGVTVFINDKPSYLSGSELENYLRSLPAGSIKQIEIMTNPPAKYEAAGNSGVINILIKRSTLAGFFGNTALSVRQGQYTSSNNSLNLNFNKNKISLFSNIYAGFWNSFQDLNINRYYQNEAGERLSSFSQNSYNGRGGNYINAKFGLDYYITDKTAIGISYKYLNHPGTRDIDNTALVDNANDELEQRVVADNLSRSSFGSGLYNLYVNHKIDTLGSKISVDADYVTYNSGNVQTFKNFIYDPTDALIFEDEINGNIPSTIAIYAAKTDYVKPIKDGSKFEAGLKTAFTKTDNEAIYSTTIDNITEPDYNLSNRFLFDEWINAGYVNYSRSFGAIDIQAGLRAESTKLTGDQLGNVQTPDTAFTRSYNALFPTFYTALKMDSTGNNRLTFSYGRRIDRPYFQDLNPFLSPLDKFTIYSGNPDLVSTFSHNLSLAHSFKSLFTTTLNYSKTLDGINETLEIRDGIYYSRPGNIATNQSLTLSFEGSFELTSWYNLNGYVEVGHLKFDSDLYTEQLNSQGTYYYLSATNSFNLGKGWKMDVSGRYRSDIVSAQLLIKSYGQVNCGIQKKILDGKGNLKLAVNDLFYTRRGDGIINNLRLTDADWNSKYDSRTITLTGSLNFGKSDSNKQKYNSSGSGDEQGRVRG